jgi:hypothetical protein
VSRHAAWPESDDFNGPAGVAADASKKEGGHNCWYGPCQHTSARLTTFTKFTPQHGHIEQIPRPAPAPGGMSSS